ncbi:MAG: electron transfer flavoprotein subunit alpha/FixB family protein [Deltaproteobacteria bacterium]|nr:electron transfer flavoprotein subunit alpha/FixB family protein [Deltaproteobacteria bacterium]
MKGNILVLAESKESELDNITWELLCKGRALADQWETKLAVLVIGSDIDSMVNTLGSSEADIILTAQHQELNQYNAELYTSIITEAAKEYNPTLILTGYTYLGMEIGPAVTVRLGGSMVSNCTDLNIEHDIISVVRSMFGGTLHGRVELHGAPPHVISFEKGALPRGNTVSREPVIKPVTLDFEKMELRSKIIEILKDELGGIDITKAKILVSVGRGIGGPDKIQLIKELAEALGGDISCSRPVADMGWLPVARQVGISANNVAPGIYLACGISGASQHVTAIRDSGKIIAINKDPNAPIFRVADYGIVGDLFDVIPEIISLAKSTK